MPMPRFQIPASFKPYCLAHPKARIFDLAAEYGVSESLIKKWRIALGIKNRSISLIDYDQLDSLLREGKAPKEIRALTGWSRSSINTRKCQLLGVTRNYVRRHMDEEVAEPVKPTSEIIADLLAHKRRELGFDKAQMEAWIGGQAWRQTMEGVGR